MKSMMNSSFARAPSGRGVRFAGWLFGFVGWSLLANDPGGGTQGVGPNVTLTDNGSTVTLANGTLTAQITKDNAHITSLLYQGRQLVNGDIYFSMDGGTSYSQPGGCVVTVVTNTPDMVDIGFLSRTNSRPQKFDIDIHYVLRRGDYGLYVYAVLDHPASYPATSVGEWRMVWKMDQDPTERIYVDDLRNWQKPSAYDLANADSTAIGEIVKLTTGFWAGRYTCKYMYAVEYEDVGCYGHASDVNKFGVWAVFGGFDYFNDGPTKQDLAPADNIIHIHFGRNHYNASSTSVTNGESWTKMYGPWLLYCNTNAGGGDACWADAKAQAAAEKAAWPYTWLIANTNYPQSTGRGAVSGQFVVNDPFKPALTVSTNAWIGLAQPDAGGNWQFESKRYQYWVHPDGAGNFLIPNVRPGTFTLYAFTPGAVGEYSLGNVTVSAGITNALGTLTWNVPHASDRLAWEIGVPDRTAREFRFGTNYWEPFLWEQYSNVFPNPLEYTVGTSNWTNDWNYAHPGYLNGGTWEPWKWNVHFQLTNRPAVGDAKLTFAWASANYGAVRVFVNDSFAELGEVGPTCYGGPTGGNALIREGIHAKYGVDTFTIPASLLREGSNTLTLFQRRWDGASDHVMYDYLNLEVPNVAVPPAGRNLTWKGGLVGNAWDVNLTLNWLEGATTTRFQQGDTVTFNDSGNNSVPITLTGSLLPGSVVVNASKNYTFNGGGWLNGFIPLVKSGSGTLTLNSSNAFGGGITVNAGTLKLGSDTANSILAGDITLNGGTFSMYDNNNSYNNSYWNLIVPDGANASFNADGRCDLFGRLEGAGTLNLNVKFVRTALRGNLSGFTGRIHVTTDSDGGDLRLVNGGGLPLAAVNLGDKATAYYALAGPAVIPIGELAGTAGATLASSDTAGSGPITWLVGGRNTDATFAGRIVDRQGATAITKVGAGSWTLSGTNQYSGPTQVGLGTLSLTGSMTTTNWVVVSNQATLRLSGILTAGLAHIRSGGTLAGCGTLNAALVNDGLVLADCGVPGVLTINGHVTNNGTMRLVSGTSLDASGVFVNNGVLDLMTAGGTLPTNLVNHGVILDSSNLPVQSISRIGSTITIQAQSFSGHTYQLQSSTSFNPPIWQDLGVAQEGTGGVIEFTDPGGGVGQGYYRLRVWP
jgi:rhamnogalacturonan endolyase